MNLVLFEAAELDRPLPRNDRRAVHVLEVLRRGVGDSFDAGIINGPRGKATISHLDETALQLNFAASAAVPAPAPLSLIVGLSRPQTARDILRDATTLGVAAIHFVRTEKSEPSYAQSPLWTAGEWRRHAIAGAEQAFDTRIPDITHSKTLRDALAETTAHGSRLALDNYEATAALGVLPTVTSHVTLAIGPERGWSAGDRGHLRENGFLLVHLGSRVLRTETACVAALTLVRTKLGLM